MTFQLVCIEPKELTQYKSDMQEAFQKGFEDAFDLTNSALFCILTKSVAGDVLAA